MNNKQKDDNCALCGLNVGRHPFTRGFEDDEKAFCCLGCMNVYTILLESGAIAAGQDVRETELFKRSLALGLISNGGAGRTGPPFPEIPSGAPTREALLQISGMWCSACAWLIESVLMSERGVVSAEAFFTSDLVKVKYCPQYLPPDRIVERIQQLGYQASDYTGENEAANVERRDLLLRLGVAGFLYLNIMTLSTALYVGYFEQIAESVSRFLPFVLMGLATPIVFYSAMPILRLMWQGFIHRVVRMETLLGIGILAAYFYSAAQAFRGESHVYFDTASAIVTLVLLGKLIERNAKARTARSITLLYRMMPNKVRLLEGSNEHFVSIDALESGDAFIVKAGERIPADGVVIEGNSYADESLLTGESAPVAKEIGSSVVGGSVNIGGVLQVRATKVGDDTTLAQIIRLVERAMSSRSSLERTVDHISRVFVPGVIVIAALTFIICWLGGFADVSGSLMRAITVLVIACPCALGMATPLAITAAIGASSRHGILVSDSRVLETIRRVDAVIFDKTGTITEGDFVLLDVESPSPLRRRDRRGPAEKERERVLAVRGRARGTGDISAMPHRSLRLCGEPILTGGGQEQLFETEYLSLIASLERYSEHPLGRAVLKRAGEDGVEFCQAREVEVHKGQGITGLVAGHRVFIGNRRLAECESTIITSAFELRASEWERAGRTVAFFGWGGRLRGLMAFGDRIEPEAADAIAALKQRGVKTMIVSGDASDTTAWVSSAVGADDFIAEALPDDKTRIIEEMQSKGLTVAMIGDGINDAPALAQADLGIAVGSGADVAMKAAAIVLMTNSPAKLLDVFDIAKKTWRVVRQNLFWAFFYNTIGIGLAVTGVLNPIMAAGAMLLSSLSVIGNSLRLSVIKSGSRKMRGRKMKTDAAEKCEAER
jgi:cation transport ATPase